MTFESDVARLTPLFERAEREHRELTALFKAGGKASPAYAELLSRHRADWEEIESIAEGIRDGLRRASAEAIELALAFLSIRARPFRSGYACSRVARALKRAALSERQAAALRKILLDRLSWPWGQSTDLWRCYPAVRTPASDAVLRDLARSAPPPVSRRAKIALSKLPKSAR